MFVVSSPYRREAPSASYVPGSSQAASRSAPITARLAALLLSRGAARWARTPNASPRLAARRLFTRERLAFIARSAAPCAATRRAGEPGGGQLSPRALPCYRLRRRSCIADDARFAASWAGTCASARGPAADTARRRRFPTERDGDHAHFAASPSPDIHGVMTPGDAADALRERASPRAEDIHRLLFRPPCVDPSPAPRCVAFSRPDWRPVNQQGYG